MKKALMFSLVLVLILGVFSGCGGNEEDVTESVQVTTETEEDVAESDEVTLVPTGNVQVTKELEQMINHFRSAGLEIGEYEEKKYEIIGATAGFGLEIEGGYTELYYYDPEKADSDILDSLEDKHNPEAAYAFVINGYYELSLAHHPQQERIIEVFMSF